MNCERAGARKRSCALFYTVGVFAIGILTGCGAGPEAGRITELTFRSADGIELSGTIYRPTGEKPPGLVLVHTLNTNREHWGHFAESAGRAGYMSIAFDLRGHGASARRRQDDTAIVLTDTSAVEALADVAAAKEQLIAAGADPDNIGVIGASIGANLALIHAQRDRTIQAVVLLSPGETYLGLDSFPAMEGYVQRPVLIMAGEGDTYAASASVELEKKAHGFCELRLYPGSAHGTDLLATHSSAEGQILQWLDGIFTPNISAVTR